MASEEPEAAAADAVPEPAAAEALAADAALPAAPDAQAADAAVADAAAVAPDGDAPAADDAAAPAAEAAEAPAAALAAVAAAAEAADAAPGPAVPTPAPTHLLPLQPAPPAQPVQRIIRAAFAATGLPEILGQRATEADALTVQLVGVTPQAGAIRASARLRFVVRLFDFAAAPTAAVSLHPLGSGHAPFVLVSQELAESASDAARGAEFKGAPGIGLRFEVSGDAAESARLGAYMRGGGHMQVEAWDDASLLHLGTARVPLADLANGTPEVWHEAALLEPVLPSQDTGHAGRCCGLLQLRVALCPGKKKHAHAPKAMAEPVSSEPADAKKKSRPKAPTEQERKLQRLQRLQAAQFSTSDAPRLDLHNQLDDTRAEAKAATIKQSLEAAAEQKVTVECDAGSSPFFEHQLTNLQSRKKKYTVTCSAGDSLKRASRDADGTVMLTAAHHKGAVLELITDAAKWRELKAVRGLTTPISEAVCGAQLKEKEAPKKGEEPEGEADGDVFADVSYVIELAAGETVYLPFHWRILEHSGAEPLGEHAPLDMAQLLGARPLPHGAVFAAEVGLLHAVGSGRTSLDPSHPEDCAVAAGRVKISGGGRLGVVSQLMVQLLPRPLVVDETLSLYGIEHGMLHASIPLARERLPAWRQMVSAADPAAFRSWRVVCTDANVGARIAWGSGEDGSPTGAEIQLQTRCGEATEKPKICYLFLYAGAGCVSAVVQLLLNTARACSVYARYAGQSNEGSMLLPAGLSHSSLEHFSSDPVQLAIEFKGTNEAMLSVSTTSAGEHCWRTSAVQPAVTAAPQSGGSPRNMPRKILGQCLVSSSVPEIEISRTLRVRVHRVPALRVEISNGYGVAKTFSLHTNRPELLSTPATDDSPRVRAKVTVPARSTQSVKWDVAVGSSATTERTETALVFVTDDRDKIEETIELTIEILPMPPSASASPVTSPVGSTVPLTITTSADLTVDDRYDVIVNSVSPEFQSSGSDSGINFSVWKTLTGFTGDAGAKPPPIKYNPAEFAARNGAGPTYADCLWSKVEAVEGSALKYIVHALAPDLSNRPKRLQSGLSKEQAYAALVAVYFRAMWQATAVAGAHCSIGMPPLGSGVFANDPADVMSAAALAHAAYRASGGTATVAVVLWSPDGKPPKDTNDWNDAASAAPAGRKNNALLAALREALSPNGSPTLAKVPKAHTTGEMTALLEGAREGDPRAADFLAARAEKDKAKQKALKKQLADGTWQPLLSSLAEKVDSSPPFKYPSCPSGGGCDALLEFMRSAEFLHFPVS